MKDILVTLKSYPDPTPRQAIQDASALARRLDAKISGAVCQIGIPQVANFLANRMVGANDAIAGENRTSRSNTQALIEALQEEAGATLAGPPLILECGHVVEPAKLTEHARLFDLTIVPAYGHPDTRNVAEALIFGSGRPVLLVPSSAHGRSFGTIVVAWDGSRGATRAVHDALPLLRKADSVQLVSVTGEKALPAAATLDRLCVHLQRHGISAEQHRLPADGKDAGSVLLSHSETKGADLMVMGAYGQSRLREFILGGATATLLMNDRIPTFLAH